MADVALPSLPALPDSEATPTKRGLASLLSDGWLRACALFTLVTLLMPAEGVSWLDFCPAMRFTGAPCPGCGITRCGANLLRGDLDRAFRYHPLGILVLPAVNGLGVLALLPRLRRERIRRVLARWLSAWGRLGLAVVVGFFLLGWLRWLLVFLGWISFPMQ